MNDKLALLHPSLGLAFTAEFSPCKAADQLPEGCDGCRETITGDTQCCLPGFELSEDEE